MSKKYLLVSNLVARIMIDINPFVAAFVFVMNKRNSECSSYGDQDHHKDDQAPNGKPMASSKTFLVSRDVHSMLLHFLLQEKKYKKNSIKGMHLIPSTPQLSKQHCLHPQCH